MARSQEEITLLREQLARRDTRIKALEEQLRLMRSKNFASSSEKVSQDQRGLFNEAEDECCAEIEDVSNTETVTIKAHQRQPKPRVSISEDLPREEIIHDTPEEEKVRPRDRHALEVIGSDDHEQLDIIPAQVKALRHRRLKYACLCCDQHIITAKKPNQPIEKSIASPGVLAFVATQKYCDALPLYRQSEIFKRIGIELNRTNLANWMVKMDDLTQPLIDHLTNHLQQQNIVHMDETTLQVLDEPGKATQSKSYMWFVLVN